MSGYQVFVERPTSAAPDALPRLAAAMAERYGLPLDQLEPRLRAGRFRVKTNVDLATAERFAADLEKLGAIVSVLDGNDVAVVRAKPVAARPAPAKPTPAPAKPTPAPAKPTPAPAPAKPAPAPAAKPAAGPQYQVGLAAAFGEHSDDTDLGALGDASGSFALSALDGTDDQDGPSSSGTFAPPSASADSLPASMGPAIVRAPEPPKHAAAEPIDMFAPPDAEEPMDLAVDIPDRSKRASSMPPPVAAAAAARPSARTTAQPPMAMHDAPAPLATSSSLGDKLRAFAGHRRARFATGALLAVLIGFLPAHLLSSVREHSAYAEIDKHLAEKQAQAQSIEQWNQLDKIRDNDRDQKVAEKHSIAVLSLLLWAGVSAGFVFVWFRKIDWDRLAR